MVDKKIRVLVFPIGSVGLVQEIEPTLAEMYRLTESSIVQFVPYDHGAELVCDEHGKFNGAQPNRVLWNGRDVAMGPIFFIGPADEEGNSTSLTDEQIQKLKEEFDG
jgi:hypothetical protein